MALEMVLSVDTTGAVYPVAYVRVNGLSVDTLNEVVTVHTAAYFDAGARADGKTPVSVASLPGDYEVIVGAETKAGMVGRSYVWLKGLDEFKEAKDV